MFTFLNVKRLAELSQQIFFSPNSLKVSVDRGEGNIKTMTKEDLLNSYKHVTNNSYLRRLAESLATEISTYAENNKHY
jgi:hypothetical protein